ncbi:hypothetical protein PHMEG_00035178 [Phytophthora megakarya]|uniref:Uncharacterized protein n=1 Tax=Phytophthora megakarya TaxID=4795 RepID=A0A225UPV5_9STRA|nr:hypothetical protein PHMEG_00035178 [Phytophthora megakarya]
MRSGFWMTPLPVMSFQHHLTFGSYKLDFVTLSLKPNSQVAQKAVLALPRWSPRHLGKARGHFSYQKMLVHQLLQALLNCRLKEQCRIATSLGYSPRCVDLTMGHVRQQLLTGFINCNLPVTLYEIEQPEKQTAPPLVPGQLADSASLQQYLRLWHSVVCNLRFVDTFFACG